MKIECPICESALICERITDGIIIHRIKGNDVKKITNESNGLITVQCENNPEHEIPNDLADEALSLTNQ